MKPPKTVDIGPTRYKVVMGAEDMPARGYFRTYDGIELRSKMPKDMEAEVLLHEVLHAIMYTFNEYMNLKKKDEERIVSNLSTSLATVFRQNPKLLKYLTETLR